MYCTTGQTSTASETVFTPLVRASRMNCLSGSGKKPIDFS